VTDRTAILRVGPDSQTVHLTAGAAQDVEPGLLRSGSPVD
jgi:hypothetical protein